MDLPKLVDNRTKACFLGKWHSLETNCSVLSFISRYPATRRHRTAWYQTEHQLRMNWHINAASLWRHRICTYTYEHGRHGIPWRLSACANSVYQALFLLPLRAWEWGYLGLFQRALCHLGALMCPLGLPQKKQSALWLHLKTNNIFNSHLNYLNLKTVWAPNIELSELN